MYVRLPYLIMGPQSRGRLMAGEMQYMKYYLASTSYSWGCFPVISKEKTTDGG